MLIIQCCWQDRFPYTVLTGCLVGVAAGRKHLPPAHAGRWRAIGIASRWTSSIPGACGGWRGEAPPKAPKSRTSKRSLDEDVNEAEEQAALSAEGGR